MFSNIGKKIKLLVTCVVIVLSAFFFTLGLSIFFGEDSSVGKFGGLLIAVIGPLFSWISAFLIYGYGEMIDRICSMERMMAELLSKDAGTDPRERAWEAEEKMIDVCETNEDENEPLYNPVNEDIKSSKTPPTQV